MKYEHSTLVTPSTYSDFGFCGGIPLRESKYGHLADKGSQRAQEDWNQFIGGTVLPGFGGCMSPRFNMTSVTIPECLPDRMEVIAYANEFAFLQDDVTEYMGVEQMGKDNDDFSLGFSAGTETTIPTSPPLSGKSRMQARLVSELMAQDRTRAEILINCWEQLAKHAASGSRKREFLTLDDYVPWRILDVGET
ncbi:MAG: hypothetical protein Q9195_005382 [Heterodermia aff. obscurata]